MIIKPFRLSQGDGISVVAPAGPVTEPELQPGIDLLKSLGHRVIPAAGLYSRKDYLAGDDDSRLGDLHAMFRNKEVKAIICARGGYGTLRLLDRLDYDLIRRNPKIVVGYSDITALLWAIYKKTGLITFHGPMVKELSKNESRNLKSLLALVSSDGPLELDLGGGRALLTGKARGTLLGGNLSLICHLIGTPYMPSLKGAVLFIEDKGEPLYRIDRMLTHLRLSGVLEGLAGLLAGGFEDCDEPSAIDELLADTVAHLNIPVVTGLKVGHGLENITLPLGLTALFDAGELKLSVEQACIPA